MDYTATGKHKAFKLGCYTEIFYVNKTTNEKKAHWKTKQTAKSNAGHI